MSTHEKMNTRRETMRSHMEKTLEKGRRTKILELDSTIFVLSYEVFGMRKIGAIIRSQFPKTKTSLRGIAFLDGRKEYGNANNSDRDEQSPPIPFNAYDAFYKISITHNNIEDHHKTNLDALAVDDLLLIELRKEFKSNADFRSMVFTLPEEIQLSMIFLKIIAQKDLNDAPPMTRAAFLEGDLGL